MAGVDHAFQYSVEVKSRFSLFLDDALNSEDPDLLLSKIQSQRSEKSKKDKHHVAQPPEPKLEAVPKEEPKTDTQSKAKVVRVPRQAKPSPAEVIEDNHVDAPPKEPQDAHPVPQAHGRGGPRGFSRGFRGGRGYGPRPSTNEWSQEPSGDLNVESTGNREAPYEPRGRGRGRGFGRGRGRGIAHTDYREYDRGGMRPRGRGGYSGGARSAPEEETSPQIAEGGDSAPPEVDVTEAPVENDDTVEADNPESAEEEPYYTLEEYKAMRSTAKPTVMLTTKGARKANDGKDVFANMVAHRKLNEVSDEEVEEVEKEPEEPQAFDIDVSFTDRFGERGRGSRGFNNRGFDRGRGRGSNFRGRPRGERGIRGGRGTFRGEGRGRGFSRGMPAEHHVPPPAINSDQDFPSLK